MARARNIKPGFYKNEELAECSILARFIFPGLWMLADREGRLEDRPKRIKGELLPFDDADVHALLDELDAQGLIQRYRAGRRNVIQIINFRKHQHPHVNEPASGLPAPEEAEPTPEDSGAAPVQDTEVRCADPVQAPEQHQPSTNPIRPLTSYLIPHTDSLSNTVSSEPNAKSRIRSKPAARRNPYERFQGEVVATLPVVGNGTGEFPIRSDFVSELQQAYPQVDVAATLPEIRAWCLANPNRRKTPSGIFRFVHSWIAREQNRG